jgi:hypothetical protein
MDSNGMACHPAYTRGADEPLLENSLAPQAEFGDEAPVSLYVFPTQIVEESPTLADHEQQTTTAVVVVLVVTKMFGQVVDPLGEQSDLDFRRTGVTSVSPELFNDFGSCLHCA